jgi:hypothetical protein
MAGQGKGARACFGSGFVVHVYPKLQIPKVRLFYEKVGVLLSGDFSACA